MKSEFVDAFLSAKKNADDMELSSGGYKVILRFSGWRLIPMIIWELLTTFVVFLPASDYHRFVCNVISRNWDCMTEAERKRVLATLLRLDGNGEISAVLHVDSSSTIIN